MWLCCNKHYLVSGPELLSEFCIRRKLQKIYLWPNVISFNSISLESSALIWIVSLLLEIH
jgi:hypothetical protein